MSAKENFLFTKLQSFASENTDNGYFNLNLNQNHKCVNVSPIQSQSKSYNDKNCTTSDLPDFTVSQNYEEKGKSQTWNKSSIIGLCSQNLKGLNLNGEVEGAEKHWKKDYGSSTSTTSSTLSLHIAAYENSNESTVASDSTGCIETNTFEFPRQQNDKVTEPEMSQFQASQRLLNPNEGSKNNQEDNPTPKMAAEVESAADSQIGGGGGEVSYPLKVIYCGACSMPLEYCEYSTCKDACREWLEKNLPNLAGDISLGDGGDEKKHQKRGGKGTSTTKGSKKQQGPAKVTLQLSARSKNKNVTLVKGLATFGVDLKVASKAFSSKFACGCSVTGADEITIQGDFTDQLFDLIPEKWKQIDEDSIEDLGGEPNSKR